MSRAKIKVVQPMSIEIGDEVRCDLNPDDVVQWGYISKATVIKLSREKTQAYVSIDLADPVNYEWRVLQNLASQWIPVHRLIPIKQKYDDPDIFI